VAADQDYEVRRLAEKHGISLERARDLIATHVKLQPSFRLLLLAFRGCYQSPSVRLLWVPSLRILRWWVPSILAWSLETSLAALALAR
jgi:hypothetical protein